MPLSKAHTSLVEILSQRNDPEDAKILKILEERASRILCEEDKQDAREACKSFAEAPVLETKDAKALQPCFRFPVVELLRQPLTQNSLQFFGTVMIPPEVAYKFSVDYTINREPLKSVKISAKDWPWEMQMALTSGYSRDWIAKACKGCPLEDIGAVLTNAVKMMCLAVYSLEVKWWAIEGGEPWYRKDLKFDFDDTRAAFAKACEGGPCPESYDTKDFLIQ